MIMKKYEITKEQIIELALRSGKASIWLQQNFKDAFKKPLEKGKWYIDKYKRLFVPVEILDSENCLGYGFGCFHNDFIYLNKIPWEINGSEIEASQEQVFEALKIEAVKRDLIHGYYAEFGTNKDVRKITSDQYSYDSNINVLLLGSDGIFDNGVWATLVPTITKAEAEKELKCKIID